MLHVGQKVVCVRDSWHIPWPGYTPTALAKAGVEYVVRSIFHEPVYGESIRLSWMINPPLPHSGVEPPFAVYGVDGKPNFRPVVEKSTEAGMEILRRLLDPTRAPVKEDA